MSGGEGDASETRSRSWLCRSASHEESLADPLAFAMRISSQRVVGRDVVGSWGTAIIAIGLEIKDGEIRF